MALRSNGSSVPLQHEVLLECKDGMRCALRDLQGERTLTVSKLNTFFKYMTADPVPAQTFRCVFCLGFHDCHKQATIVAILLVLYLKSTASRNRPQSSRAQGASIQMHLPGTVQLFSLVTSWKHQAEGQSL